jgi:hypothetical protein
LSKGNYSYDKAKEHILNLLTNNHSPSGVSSKNSKPQHKAIGISSSNGMKEEKMKEGVTSSSYSGSEEPNWDYSPSPDTMCGYIWTQGKELKVRRNQNGPKIVARV